MHTTVNDITIEYRLDGPEAKDHAGFDRPAAYSPEGGRPDVSPVVFSHSLATNLTMWDPQIEAVAERYRTLRYDIRGHGGTSVTPPPYSLVVLADDLAGLLDVLGLDRIHLVGLSLGGMIAQVFALRHPDRLCSLVLCDTSSRTPPDAHAMWDERIRAAQIEGMEQHVEPTIERWFTPAFVQGHREVVDGVRDMIRSTDPQGYAGCAAAVRGHDAVDRLGEIQAPTLIMAGSEDSGMPLEVVERMRVAIPGAESVIIESARHLCSAEQPERFNEALLAFLGRVDGWR
jgi:3-oxoadipate enol-lactonase